jgi:hypothetical protein
MNQKILISGEVNQYWEKQRQYYVNNSLSLSIDLDQKKYETYLESRKGLLFGSYPLLVDSIQLIASGFKQLGLGKARMSKRFAESALEVGDLIYLNEPPEHGRHMIYANLSMTKWILGEVGWELLCRDSVKYWCDYLAVSGVSQGKYPPYLKKEHLWEAIIPYLLIEDIKKAMEQFQIAFSTLNIDPVKITQNAKSEEKTLGVVINYLSGNSDMENTARETLAQFRLNASRWGCDEGSKTDLLWKEIFVPRHLLLARIWAKFFSKESDPIKIILSIR